MPGAPMALRSSTTSGVITPRSSAMIGTSPSCCACRVQLLKLGLQLKSGFKLRVYVRVYSCILVTCQRLDLAALHRSGDEDDMPRSSAMIGTFPSCCAWVEAHVG